MVRPQLHTPDRDTREILPAVFHKEEHRRGASDGEAEPSSKEASDAGVEARVEKHIHEKD